MSDTSKPGPNVVSLATARRRKSAGDKPRHVRKQEARAEKTKLAEANRVRSGRTKAEKAQDRSESARLKTLLDGSRRDDNSDT